MLGLNTIVREAWTIADQDSKVKTSLFSICYIYIAMLAKSK